MDTPDRDESPDLGTAMLMALLGRQPKVVSDNGWDFDALGV